MRLGAKSTMSSSYCPDQPGRQESLLLTALRGPINLACPLEQSEILPDD